MQSAEPRKKAANRLPFNDRTIRGLQASSGRLDYWDESLPGFGIRVSAPNRKSPAGRKVWQVMYRPDGAPQRRQPIGTFPPMSLADARDRARKILLSVQDGKDPVADKRAELAAETFPQLAREYMDKHAVHKRSGREDQRIIDRYLLSPLKDRRLRDISRAEVRRLIESVSARRLRPLTRDPERKGAPVMANRVLALARKMFNFALEREWIEANPCAAIKRVAPEEARSRILSDQEIRDLWLALDQESPIIRDYFRLLLLTGQRKGETLKITWEQIDFAEKLWTIPAANAKNKREHLVPLSKPALELLQAIRDRRADAKRALAERGDEPDLRNDSQWVFVSPKSREPKCMENPQKAVERVRKLVGFDFSLHDLRRTLGTNLGRLGYNRLIQDKVLNHADRDEVAAIYDRWTYQQEKRAALDAWSAALAEILRAQDEQRAEASKQQPEPETAGKVLAFRRA